MMVAFHDIVDAQDVAFEAGNREADGIGAVSGRKTRTGKASVAEITALAERIVGWA
jgi:hypothetical protein